MRRLDIILLGPLYWKSPIQNLKTKCKKDQTAIMATIFKMFFLYKLPISLSFERNMLPLIITKQHTPNLDIVCAVSYIIHCEEYRSAFFHPFVATCKTITAKTATMRSSSIHTIRSALLSRLYSRYFPLSTPVSKIYFFLIPLIKAVIEFLFATTSANPNIIMPYLTYQ